MTYTEASKKVLDGEFDSCSRKEWHPEWSNDRIFYDEKYKSLMRTDCNWPTMYTAYGEDAKANDWFAFNYSEIKNLNHG